MKRTVVAIYETHSAANQAMDKLLAAGFDSQSISLVMSKETRERHYAGGDSAAAWGAGAGGIVGGLTGIAMAPPLGLFVAGPLLAILSATALGAAGGGLIGALVDLGVPSDQAKSYEAQLAQRGSVLVAVETESSARADEAERILASLSSAPGNRPINVHQEVQP